MANPISVPGTVVPSGSLISPGGAQGLQGLQGTTALATATQNGLLRQTSGNTTDFIDGTNNSQPLQPVIWSVRLRSFNSLGNPNFEITQRNVRTALVNPTGNSFIEDRWASGNTGLSNTYQCFQVAGGGVGVPGNPFSLTTGYLRITTGAQKASLAAGDTNYIVQFVEGPSFRELMNDVHSCQVLVRSSVANLKFGVAFRDPTNSRTLTKLCSLGAANTITIIQLPNLPIWPAAGTFTAAPGSMGYQFSICVASGSTYTSPANDTWQNGIFLAALGQDNLMASAAGSTFEAFFVQHEPGALCTTPIDCPFTQNYDDCLRYFAKSYDYGTSIGTVTNTGLSSFTAANSHGSVWGSLAFAKRMAKLPSLFIYNPGTGAANSARDPLGGNYTVSSPTTGQSGISGFSISPTLGAAAAGMPIWFHYTADTGW